MQPSFSIPPAASTLRVDMAGDHIGSTRRVDGAGGTIGISGIGAGQNVTSTITSFPSRRIFTGAVSPLLNWPRAFM